MATIKELTPMMKQFFEIKEKAPDSLLLYRMGDFYELFHDDAIVAAKILGITLTKRNKSGGDGTPLAGFPHHALEKYAHKLVKAGHKIAICDQVEDPKDAKGIVKRDIIEIISAGTGMDNSFIEEGANNYIISIFADDGVYGISLCDLSTGEFSTAIADRDKLLDEVARIDPNEILISEEHKNEDGIKKIGELFPEKLITSIDKMRFDYETSVETLLSHFSVHSIEGIGLEEKPLSVISSGSLLAYLKEQKRSELTHIYALKVNSFDNSAHLDPATIRNLELLKPIHTDETGGTLISVLGKCITSLGTRMMKKWIVRPLIDVGAINQRLDAVEWFNKDLFLRGELETLLNSVSDLERVIGRITLGRANGKDLISTRDSLRQFPHIIKLLKDSPSFLVKSLVTSLDNLDKIEKKISNTIVDEPPLSIKEGGLICEGVDEELDTIRDASINGKDWIARLQQTEREKLEIPSLKVGYNKVFGYFLEVSKIHQSKIPENYIRKQTLVNCERYITPELKEMEATVLGAEEKLGAIEFEIFSKLRNEVSNECERIQRAAEGIAIIDVISTLGKLASEKDYCRPTLDSSADMNIVDGRHPVVENMSRDQFIPNDTIFVEDKRQILLITGPNMAGKSTYLRQNALIALMAQMGSFVPASKAHIGIVDRFFTRIGASDRLARGQSTFLVEMVEVANILNNATNRSLVLLDEVGRGTSTFDGVSIAWAVAEYLHNKKGGEARTLFATHYHELIELETLLPRVANLHITVKEWDDSIVFLRKIAEGGSSHSYGIQVAALAGVPEEVIERAKTILINLEGMEFTPEHTPNLAKEISVEQPQMLKEPKLVIYEEPKESVQLDFLSSAEHPVLEKLKKIDILNTTPLDALNILVGLKKEI